MTLQLNFCHEKPTAHAGSLDCRRGMFWEMAFLEMAWGKNFVAWLTIKLARI